MDNESIDPIFDAEQFAMDMRFYLASGDAKREPAKSKFSTRFMKLVAKLVEAKLRRPDKS